eukprot:gnl/TRDRNA2_/TRDRNA2_83602_c0_seq2.p1 gnl/TRDRNA2_/TRDRNA2_83602_c0~~gnl/TRDRNA2_/TRDRNA2_83602_c0_seq2.p1  ORF type:complete len:292 (+),score=38.83 gnl/TRDRNA2_/TRDRNA2_83602_c0_seq2:90-965(+)
MVTPFLLLLTLTTINASQIDTTDDLSLIRLHQVNQPAPGEAASTHNLQNRTLQAVIEEIVNQMNNKAWTLPALIHDTEILRHIMLQVDLLELPEAEEQAGIKAPLNSTLRTLTRELVAQMNNTATLIRQAARHQGQHDPLPRIIHEVASRMSSTALRYNELNMSVFSDERAGHDADCVWSRCHAPPFPPNFDGSAWSRIKYKSWLAKVTAKCVAHAFEASSTLTRCSDIFLKSENVQCQCPTLTPTRTPTPAPTTTTTSPPTSQPTPTPTTEPPMVEVAFYARRPSNGDVG